MARAQIAQKARAKAMLCFEVVVVIVTFIWLGLVVFAGVSFVIGLLAVYWVGVLGLAAALGLIGVGRKLLRPRPS